MKHTLQLCALLYAVLSMSPVLAVTDDDLLIDLPESSALKINRPFVITSIDSRSGTSLQSVIETIKIDLKGKTFAAALSRESNQAVIAVLKNDLKNFAEIETIMCFVDFNAHPYSNRTLGLFEVFKLTTPDQFGTPSPIHTRIGKRITIDTSSDDMSLSGSFESPFLRRLYCGFHTSVYGQAGFLDDLKIKHLRLLLAPNFELQYD